MTKPSTRPFQSIPKPSTAGPVGRNTFTPSPKFLAARYPVEERAEVRQFMAWSLASGLAYIANRPMAAGLPAAMSQYSKGAGRCLWSWDDVLEDGAVPAEVEPFLAHLKEQALRPTSMFPADMRSLSPRLCIDLLGGNYARARREVELVAGAALPKHYPLDRILGLMNYGDVQDHALPLLSRVRREFPCRPGFSAHATYVAETINDSLSPFAVGILKSTLFEEDQAQRLLNARPWVEEKCREVFAGLGAYLEDDFSANYTGVVDRLLREEWHVDEFDPEDPEPDAEQVIERLILWKFHDNRTLLPGLLLGLAVLTGVSPASLTAYAVSDARRRGYSYISHTDMEALAALVENASMSQNAARCAKEIRGQVVELVDAQAGKQDVLEKLARINRARSLGQVFWEWESRLGGAA